MARNNGATSETAMGPVDVAAEPAAGQGPDRSPATVRAVLADVRARRPAVNIDVPRLVRAMRDEGY